MSSRRSTRRLTTVYDLAALQLHADGTRAAPSTSASPSAPNSHWNPNASTTSRARRTRTTTLDARGNPIARDAAGPLRVKKDVFTRADVKREEQDDAGGYFDLDAAGDKEEEEEEQAPVEEEPLNIDGGGRVLRKRKLPTPTSTPLPASPLPRPVKKRKLVDVAREAVEERFLAAPGTALAPALTLGPMPVLAGGTPDVVDGIHPSGELLKIIHRFAAQYYTERGLLSDATREYRRVKRAREGARAAERERARVREKEVLAQERMKRMSDEFEDEEGMDVVPEEEEGMDVEPEEGVHEADATAKQSGEEDEEEDQLGSEHQQRDDELPEDQDELAEDQEEEQPTPRKRRKGGEQIRDMYKGMDGSALFALGMLVQAHITALTQSLVTQRVFTTGDEEHPHLINAAPVVLATQVPEAPTAHAHAPPLDSNTAYTSAGAGMYTFETDPEDTGADEEDGDGDGDEDSDGLAEDETGDVRG